MLHARICLAAFAAFAVCVCAHTRLDTDGCIGSGCFDLYYLPSSSWSSTYLHYNAGPGWNSIPGAQMRPSSNASYPSAQGWVYISVGGNTVTWVLTNGQGSWDNNGGKNYQVSAPGVYAQSAGKVSAIATFAPGCPNACATNGVCMPQFGLCNCTAGYFGPDCTGTCPGSPTPCSGHGSCDDTGTCVCVSGWASCGSADDCSTNVQSDPQNCGSCGVQCIPDPSRGIVNAVCANSVCTVQCANGYVLCPDGTCHVGNSTESCPLPGCQTFSDNQCSGNNTETPANYSARGFQTPVPGGDGYFASYQSFAYLQGYVRVVYTDTTRTAAVLSVVTFTHDASRTSPLTYTFDGVPQQSPNITYCAPGSAAAAAGGCVASPGPVNVTVSGADGSLLLPDEVYLLWGAPAIPTQPQGDYRSGQKGAIVEFLGWPHRDVALECQNLSAWGYMGAKLFPVQETVMSWEPFQNVLNPWFFLYQPVSYRLQGRFGNSTDLAAAIAACRQLSVRMYADAVINHMVGGGNDGNPNHRNSNGGGCATWGAKNSSAMLWFNSSTDHRGVSPSFTQDFCYLPNSNTGLPPSQEFPAVPYSPVDFHCERALNSWTDPLDLNAGWLDGLVDLNTEHPYVQQRIADFFTSLLSVGFSGFRIDAAKHVSPDDHVAILTMFRNNMGGALPDDFVTWLEVLTGGEGDMLVADTNSGYNYGGYLENALLQAGWSQEDVNKVKIWASYYPKEPELDQGNIPMNRKAVQNDDADQQTTGSTSRDMGNFGCVLVTGCDVDTHRGFEVTLFQNPYGSQDNDNDYPIRMVLSSFWFDLQITPYGMPDGNSNCSLCQVNCDSCTGSMPFTPAYDPNAAGYAGPVYTRVHRDPQIIDAMRAWMQLPAMFHKAERNATS